jgi:hypothetical protein
VIDAFKDVGEQVVAWTVVFGVAFGALWLFERSS